jgi:hypothetical protein
MRLSTAFLVALVTVAAAVSQAGPHFNVSAAYVAPASKGADAAVAVTFVALDPDVRVNEEPSPRLKLDAAQTVLVDKQKPSASKAEAFDPEKAKYLDLSAPVLFPVAVSPAAPKGSQTAKANVTYFYCSKREGWCRKGTADVSVSLDVP